MAEALRRARELAPKAVVKIAAQAHLERFYGSMGFATISEVYDHYGIPHVDMIHQGVSAA
jgi:ElaA protein